MAFSFEIEILNILLTEAFNVLMILHHQPVHQTWRQFFSPTLESNEVHGELEINNDAENKEQQQQPLYNDRIYGTVRIQ
ncbi:hypothetical protein CsSME_00019916 [Camellia sinensis var. sinensis]